MSHEDEIDVMRTSPAGREVRCAVIDVAVPTVWVFMPPSAIDIEEDGVPFVGELAEKDGVVCYKFNLAEGGEEAQRQSIALTRAVCDLVAMEGAPE